MDNLFNYAAGLARTARDLTAIERHWLEQDTEQQRALAAFNASLTHEDLVRLWAYRISLERGQ